MESVFLAKDKYSFVFDELCALAELIERSNFESLRVFVENVRHERANESIGLPTHGEEGCAKSNPRDEFAPCRVNAREPGSFIWRFRRTGLLRVLRL